MTMQTWLMQARSGGFAAATAAFLGIATFAGGTA